MLSKSITVVAFVAFSGIVLVSCNPYGATYNDGYEQPSYQPQPQQSYQPQPQQSYQPKPSYKQSYQSAPAYQPQASYQPSYPKYRAPSSAHHTQYDNYYPKQTHSEPMYAQQQPTYQQPQMYQQQPSYPAPKPSYQTPSYETEQDYKMKA